MTERRLSSIAAALVAAGALAAPYAVVAQEPDTLPGDSVVAVDTILVVEKREGLVWGDWYVDPEVSTLVHSVIERRGQLSGRTWLEAAVPISDLALASPIGGGQVLQFLDKGVALDFWEPGEVEYRYVFEGPWKLRAKGVADVDPVRERVEIPLPLPKAPREGAARDRVGRLDVTYRPRGRSGMPRGSFSVYLFYVKPALGYRIAGVGY